MPSRSFDLNIEEVLENWEVEHALREIIANALDEQSVSETADITITKDNRGDWHIRDFGRGLRIEHFTLNENQEKLRAPSSVIGKFGVGLKDALATFHRRGIKLLIGSRYGTFRLRQEHKHGFDNILTLHIDYDDSQLNMPGTEFFSEPSGKNAGQFDSDAESAPGGHPTPVRLHCGAGPLSSRSMSPYRHDPAEKGRRSTGNPLLGERTTHCLAGRHPQR
jgi:hypothetical protein